MASRLEVVPAVVTGLTILNAKTVVYELASCDKSESLIAHSPEHAASVGHISK